MVSITKTPIRKSGKHYYGVDIFGPCHLDSALDDSGVAGTWFFTRVMEFQNDYTRILHETRYVESQDKAQADGETWLKKYLEDNS